MTGRRMVRHAYRPNPWRRRATIALQALVIAGLCYLDLVLWLSRGPA